MYSWKCNNDAVVHRVIQNYLMNTEKADTFFKEVIPF